MAEDAGQKDAKTLLEQERLQAPAQLAFTDRSIEVDIWIGDHVRISSMMKGADRTDGRTNRVVLFLSLTLSLADQ